MKPSGSSHITGSSLIEQTLGLLTVRPMDTMSLVSEDPQAHRKVVEMQLRSETSLEGNVSMVRAKDFYE